MTPSALLRCLTFALAVPALAAAQGSPAGAGQASATATGQAPNGPGAAQPAAPASLPPAGTAPAFIVQSDNGDNRVQLGALMHADARTSLGDDAAAVTDNFTLRRFRSIAQGRLARHFEFFLNVEYAGSLTIRDAFFDTVFSPAFRVRVGKARVPFSYDRNTLIVNALFVERGLTTAVAPDRDTGFVVLGDLARNTFSYGASLTNGSVDGGSVDGDTNDAKDVAGRVIVRPWARRPSSRLTNLGAGVAATTGIQGAALPSFVTAGRQTFFAYRAGVAGDGRRTRWSPHAYFYLGPFGAYGEYVRSRGGVARGADAGEVDHEAWQVSAAWNLTGETAVPERNVRPRANFNPPTRTLGALQLTARVQRLSIGQEAFARELTVPEASRRADVATVGLNWYPNPFVKWLLNYERTAFDGGTRPRPTEHTVVLRAQLGF